MGKKRKELTHEEIWDDTGLIRSWNASYEEYKLYHSIHARGENLDDALAAAERDDEGADGDGDKPDRMTSNVSGDVGADEGVSHKQESQMARGSGDAVTSANHVGAAMQDPIETAGIRETGRAQADGIEQQGAGTNGPNEGAERTLPAMSGGMSERLAQQSSQDGALKNLMMSWYWAGYYSGIYEGEQRAAWGNGQSNER